MDASSNPIKALFVGIRSVPSQHPISFLTPSPFTDGLLQILVEMVLRSILSLRYEGDLLHQEYIMLSL